jgi:isopenicillin N synthase-like dioxygenase
VYLCFVLKKKVVIRIKADLFIPAFFTERAIYPSSSININSIINQQSIIPNDLPKITMNPSSTTTSIPTISLSNPSKLFTARSIHAACTSTGFFYLKDHSVPSSLTDSVLHQSSLLFALPLHEKNALIDSILNRGYTRFEEEKLDPSCQERGDTKEGYYIGKEVEVRNAAKLRGPNVWPTTATCSWTEDQCYEFRSIMEQYHAEVMRVCMDLLTYFSLAVGLCSEESFDERNTTIFNPFFTDPTTVIRLLHYSNEPSVPEEGVFACGAHSDYGMITLLLTDDNPGLQVKVSGTWIDVPPQEGAFVVNIGDMFERWTNGLFHSTIHRVIQPANGKERYSVPFFFEPDFDAVCECLDVCCGDTGPKYPPITAGQHLLYMYQKTHADFDNRAD